MQLTPHALWILYFTSLSATMNLAEWALQQHILDPNHRLCVCVRKILGLLPTTGSPLVTVMIHSCQQLITWIVCTLEMRLQTWVPRQRGMAAVSKSNPLAFQMLVCVYELHTSWVFVNWGDCLFILYQLNKIFCSHLLIILSSCSMLVSIFSSCIECCWITGGLLASRNCHFHCPLYEIHLVAQWCS